MGEAFNVWTGRGEKAIPLVVLSAPVDRQDCHQIAQVAQLVEQRTENPRVGGSNPPLGTISKEPRSVETVT